MHKYRIILILLSGIFILLLSGISFILFTTKGIETLLTSVLSRHAEKENIEYFGLEGTLVQGVTFDNIELKNLKDFPEGTVLQIQRLFVNLTSIGIDGLEVEIENGRLRLPDSETIVINGILKNELLDFNVFSNGLIVESLLEYFPSVRSSAFKVTGSVSSIDLFIKGDYLNPAVTGSFVIDHVNYKGILLSEAEGDLDLILSDLNDDIQLKGEVSVRSGMVKSKRTIVRLDKSKVFFSGPPTNPGFNLKGESKIEKIKINIELKGTLEKPDLILTSEPSLPKEKIMLMLATGKSWKGAEESLQQGVFTTSLTKDFIDYFIFAGKGNKFAEKFGLSELSINFDKEKSGIAVKKTLTEAFGVGYGVEQTKENGQVKDVTQKLEGEINVTNKLSVGVEREIKQTLPSEVLSEPVVENNDKVLLKYKKSF